MQHSQNLAVKVNELLLNWSQRGSHIVYSPEFRQLLSLVDTKPRASKQPKCSECSGTGLTERKQWAKTIIGQCKACMGEGFEGGK